MNTVILILAPVIAAPPPLPVAPDPPAAVTARKSKVIGSFEYGGVVTQITPTGITIVGAGERAKAGRIVKVRGARTFAPSANLQAGKYGFRHGATNFTYRWADVKVGDRVVILFDQIAEETEVCATICIQRRPGGRVPPAPGEADLRARFPGRSWPPRYHEMVNARQAFEENNTPIPDHLLSPWEREASMERTAPMPRLIKPRVP